MEWLLELRRLLFVLVASWGYSVFSFFLYWRFLLLCRSMLERVGVEVGEVKFKFREINKHSGNFIWWMVITSAVYVFIFGTPEWVFWVTDY